MDKHIAFCINDGYAPYVAVVIKSLVVNNPGERYVIHILADSLTDASVEFIRSQCAGNPLQIHEVDDSELKKLKNTWTTISWYRILLPGLLSDVDRVLYLDADVLVTGSVSDLFEINMTGKSVAGVIDVQAFNQDTRSRLGEDAACRYICAGVLMMNLDYWRTHDLTERVCGWAVENDRVIAFPDQDAINAVCAGSRIVLPMKYGVLDAHFHYVWRYSEDLRQQALDALDHPVIVHYAGQAPWIYERMYHQFQCMWDRYNSMLEKPVRKVHYKERNKSARLVVRRLLDRLHIMRLPRWYATENLSDEELRNRIEHGTLVNP